MHRWPAICERIVTLKLPCEDIHQLLDSSFFKILPIWNRVRHYNQQKIHPWVRLCKNMIFCETMMRLPRLSRGKILCSLLTGWLVVFIPHFSTLSYGRWRTGEVLDRVLLKMCCKKRKTNAHSDCVQCTHQDDTFARQILGATNTLIQVELSLKCWYDSRKQIQLQHKTNTNSKTYTNTRKCRIVVEVGMTRRHCPSRLGRSLATEFMLVFEIVPSC